MTSYEEKFRFVLELCNKLKPGDVVYIAMPQAWGDNYEELVESLNRISDTGSHISIVPRKERTAETPLYRKN